MVNKVTLIGRLGKDPQMKTLDSGTPYVRCTIATNESYKDKSGEWQDQTEWHNIILWGDQANRFNASLYKGALIYLEGKLTHRSWKDNDGVSRNMTEVKVKSYRKLDKSSNTYDAPKPKENPVDQASTENGKPDDLPF